MVNVFIPTMLRKKCNNINNISVDGINLREIINNLELHCPGIEEILGPAWVGKNLWIIRSVTRHGTAIRFWSEDDVMHPLDVKNWSYINSPNAVDAPYLVIEPGLIPNLKIKL